MSQPRNRPDDVPGEPLDLFVDGFTHGGEGVVRVPTDGGRQKAMFVPGTLPGERVRVEVTDERKRWARGRLVEVLEPADGRVEPPCPYVTTDPPCGGCDLQHADPALQRQLKTRVVSEQLHRIGGIDEPPVDECRPVGPDVGYRMHAQLHTAPDGRLGFHAPGSHDVVPIERCLILTDEAQSVLDDVRSAPGTEGVEISAAGSERAVLIHPGEGGLDMPDADVDVCVQAADGAVHALRGDGVLHTTVHDIELTHDVSSFFQVSRSGAQALTDAVLAAVGDVSGALVWDLYAGVGLFSVPLARSGADVIAVEGHEAASRWVQVNAEHNDCAVSVETADVREFVARPDVEPPDVVVLDPPRTGAGENTVARLAELAPGRIVYVACDVAALARDARVLESAGYRLTRATPLDLFPMTHHVETVAVFAP